MSMIKNEMLIARYRDEIAEWLLSFKDPTDRALAIAWIIEQEQQNITRLSEKRRELLIQMREDGRSIRRIASDLGITSTRVEQLTRPRQFGIS